MSEERKEMKMQCVECKKEIEENAGTNENPLCQSCYDGMKHEHASDTTLQSNKKKLEWLIPVAIPFLILVARLYYEFHTPAFALKSIASAIENHDWAKFSKFVDVESFYNTTVKGALEDSDNGIGTLMASNMKEAFIDQLKTQIEQPEEGTISLFHQLFDKDNVLLSKMRTENKGKIVQILIPRKTKYLDLEIPVIFNFRKGPMHLTLTSMDMSKFDNAEDKIKQILKEHYLLPVRDSLSKLVTIETVKKYKGCSNWVYETCFGELIMISSRVTNNSDADIAKVDFEIFPGEIWKTLSKTKKYQDASNIKVGESVLTGTRQGWKYNQFDDEDQLFMNADKNEICFNVTKIEFKNGSTIEEDKYSYISRYYSEKPTLEDILKRRESYGLNDGFEIRQTLSGEQSGM